MARVPEGPDPLLVDAAVVVLPPVGRHRFPDALDVVVVLPLWGDVQEGIDLIPADVGGSAMPLEPFAQEVRPRIDEFEVAIPGEDRVLLLIGAPVLKPVAELGVGPSPDGVPGRRYAIHRQLGVAERDHHEAGAAGVVR